MFSQILAYQLAAHYLGRNGFSEYAVARRLVSLISPIPLLGLGVGLPRYIGYSNGRGDKAAASRYYTAALWCVGAAALVCFLLMNLGSSYFAFLFFGSKCYARLVFPLSIMVIGFCLHSIACGYFRGHLAMNRANLLQVLSLSLSPPLVFVVFHRNLEHVLLLQGGLWIFVAVTVLLWTGFHQRTSGIFSETKHLLTYGVQRVPGDFTLMALFTLPVTVLAHLDGVQYAGYVAFGIAVLSMIGAVFAPVGLVLLPKATYMLAEGSSHELRQHLLHMVKVTAIVSAILALSISIFARWLIRLYLGDGYEQVANIVRLVMVGALPFSLYLVLRNIIDAFHKNGVTALILLSSLAVFGFLVVGGSYVAQKGQCVIPAFLLAIVSLSAMSAWECRRIFSE